MTTKVLVPAKGLTVRDPANFNPLSETGEEKPMIGKEGRYWRRRIKDGSVSILPPVKPAKFSKKTIEKK